MIATHLLLWAGWVCFCFLHSALAVTDIKQKVESVISITHARYRLLYNLFALITLVSLLWAQYSVFSEPVFTAGKRAAVAAVLITITGAALMLACIFKYFRQLSGLDDQQHAEKLEVTGMHKWVRHPLYLATFIFLAGLFLFFPKTDNLGTIIIIIIYTLLGIRFEEKKLVSKFGDNYRIYQDQVPMIIPWLK